MNPNHYERNLSPGPKDSKRGSVTEFSDKSRRRLQRQLATMKVEATAYTMALTLPGCDVESIAHSYVIEAFKKIARRLSASMRFAGVSGYWKRELQHRGALHYHLLLYGLDDDALRAEFQNWMVAQWTSFFALNLTDEQREHHRWWHARPENMQLVRDFSGYFSKYIGKDEESVEAVPGRWWGSINKRLLPMAARSSVEMHIKEAVVCHRLARKRRQKKADAGKHQRIRKTMEKKGFNLTDLDLFRLRSGYDINGYRNPRGAASYLACYQHCCKSQGVRPGKFRFRGKIPNTAPIIVCGASAPVFATKALDWVNRSLGQSLELKATALPQDFIPDPLKPVPPGRTPRNLERVRLQSDFLDELGQSEKHRL